MVIKDTELSSLPCPIMDEESPILYSIASNVLKKAILKSFEGNPLPINKLRDNFVQLWDDHWIKLYGQKTEEATSPYWTGPRISITIAHKIITFLNKYEIITPIQPYSYTLDTYIVEGYNSIVRSKVGKVRPYLSLSVVPQIYTKEGLPDLLTLTRWYNTESSYPNLSSSGILILPLLKGNLKILTIKNISLAKDWMIQGFKQQKAIFPIIGQHCNSCKSKKCTEVLNVGQDKDRRVGWLRQISTRR